MASRNRVKQYAAESYYHVYNRGVEKRSIFLDDQDYRVFLNLLKRYLGPTAESDQNGRLYETLAGQIELLAYCLMPNHYHLLIYQEDVAGMTRLMRRVITAYSAYFNKRYTRVGPLFQDRYKAVRIDKEAYLWYISKYIHLNSGSLTVASQFPYSSCRFYLGDLAPVWLNPGRILRLHAENGESYRSFLSNSSEASELSTRTVLAHL